MINQTLNELEINNNEWPELSIEKFEEAIKKHPIGRHHGLTI